MSKNDTHNADSTLSSPGTILKRCREYHGISLEEAATATKIGENYLRALEDDQIREFANLAYLKGFLRIYATHLGLVPDDMVRLYERLYKSTGTSKNSRNETGGDDLPDHRRRFPWQKLVLPAVLILLMIITSAILNRSPSLPPQPSPKTGVVAAQAPAVQPVRSSARPALLPEKSVKDTTLANTAGNEEAVAEQSSPAKPATEPAKGFRLRMKVTQNGTLAVIIDGASAQNYDLTSGDIIEWKADRTIALELSNAGGVDTELNGKPLKPFGPVDAPIYVVLDANGVNQ